jgi:divalent metal cation (Fe/Co/Zn/Cd) transporter
MISGSIALAATTFHNFSDIDHLGWVMAAGIIGFIGKELVAPYHIRVAVRSAWRRTRHRPDDSGWADCRSNRCHLRPR